MALIGRNRLGSLYNPDLVSVVVGAERREFRAPRGLICGMSEYFDKAFGKRFKEGREGAIELLDVKPWIFECFIGWLYTQKVCWEAQSGGGEQSSGSVDGPTVDAGQVTVGEQKRFEGNLKILLRGTGISSSKSTSLRTMFQRKPTIYCYPGVRSYGPALEQLPESSPLHRLLSELVVYTLSLASNETRANFNVVSQATTAYLLMMATQLARCATCPLCAKGAECTAKSHPDIKSTKRPYSNNLCAYHEHESEEEGELCRRKWLHLAEERDIRF